MKEGAPMAKCPLIQNDCLRDDCEWWGGGIQKCLIVAIAMMANSMHDMGVVAYKKYASDDEPAPSE
jgi:hypothetical protein